MDNKEIAKLCDQIQSSLETKDTIIQKLREENKQLKANNYKDEELQKMAAKLEKMKANYNRGFPISETEEKKINKWIDEHIQKKHNGNYYAGTIGGRFSYNFTPTSIGVLGNIECSCGEYFTFQNMI